MIIDEIMKCYLVYFVNPFVRHYEVDSTFLLVCVVVISMLALMLVPLVRTRCFIT